MNALHYYRCIGADGYRFSGKAVCNNRPVRGDQLEQVVWAQVRALLEDPHRVADEYRRRIAQARDGTATLERQMTSLQCGIARLIDSYTEAILDKTEFEPRIAGLKQRVSQLHERHQTALEAVESERDLALVQMVHRDHNHRPKPLPGNIVQTLVERTFAWISRNRRLARDFERYATTVAAFVRLAMIRIMLRRLAAANPSS
jgi:hypothetical protein